MNSAGDLTDPVPPLHFLDPDSPYGAIEQLRLLVQAVSDASEAIVITEAQLDEPGPRILYVNSAFTEITGYEYEEIVGQTPRILQGPDTERVTLQRLRDHLEVGRRFEGEAVNYRKDGTPYVNHWSIAPVRDDNGTIMNWVSVQRDVTEQRRLRKTLLNVQEEERNRIAQEVHNELGGLLTSLQLNLDLAAQEAPDTAPLNDHLEAAIRHGEKISAFIRRISQRLAPRVLRSFDLQSGLDWLVGDVKKRFGLHVNLYSELDDVDNIPSLVETTAFRIVREALTNVARHAETKEARVVVNALSARLRLHVIDKGSGFKSRVSPPSQNIGLDGMRRRAEHLNGSLEIHSTPGEGTRITATLPLTTPFVST